MTHRILVAIPNMGTINHHVLSKLSYWSTFSDYSITITAITEAIFHDHARNKLCEEFLKSNADWILMIDADTDPHQDLPKLVEHGKPVIAGNVIAWVKGDMCPSIWERGDCEECKVVKLWQELGQVKDPRNYQFDADSPNILLRWNPYSQMYYQFYDREAERFWPNMRCRCEGTGRDPYVYKVSQSILKKESPIRVDSVGAAALMIRRDVIEAVPRPWFQFLFRENREIMQTEDHYFCRKASLQGYEIWADQNMPCGHYKRINLLSLNNWGGMLYDKGRADAVNRLEEMVKEREKRSIIVPDFVQ